MKTSDIPKIAVFPIGTYERHGWFTKEILEFAYTLPYNQNYMTNLITVHNFIPAAGARNHIAKVVKAMDPQPDWICMIDNDMLPPLNLLDTIKDAPEDAGVVVPAFFLWDQGKKSTILCWGLKKPTNEEGMIYEHIDKGFKPIVTAGTGVMFIRPEIFQKVPPPWFFYTFDESQIQTATEDTNFCLKIAEYGYKIYGNGSIWVGHNHTCDLSVVAQVQYRNDLPAASSETQDEPSHEEALSLPK